MSLISEVLVISGVALDLVGASVLSHSHNAESALELREEIGGGARARRGERHRHPRAATLGEAHRISTPGLRALATPGGAGAGVHGRHLDDGGYRGWVILLGLATAVIWVKVGSRKVREEAQEAAQSETEEIPEQ